MILTGRIALGVFLVLLSSTGLAAKAQSPKVIVPAELELALKTHYPKAKIHRGKGEFDPASTPATPSFGIADVNGDKQQDYIVQLDEEATTRLVALLRKGPAFEAVTIASGPLTERRVFTVSRAGSKYRDHGANKDSYFSNDAPFARMEGQDYGQSYVFENGTFRKVSSSD